MYLNPKKHAAFRNAPFTQSRKMLIRGGKHSISSFLVKLSNLSDMIGQPLITPLFQELVSDNLREGGRIYDRDLHVKHDLVHERFWPCHKSQSDAGAENLAEAVKSQHATLGVHGKEAGHFAVPELHVIVRIIL